MSAGDVACPAVGAEIEYDYELERCDWAGGGVSFSFPVLKLVNGTDAALEEVINESLLRASTEWVNEFCTWLSDCKLIIFAKSGQYVSACYTTDLGENENELDKGIVRIFITIDLSTGERVFLDDLLSDTELVEKMRSSRTYDLEHSPPITMESAREILRYASMSEQEYLDLVCGAREDTTMYLLAKPGFYFDGDMICIKQNEFLHDDFSIVRA